jgi:hypothetical protein
MSTFTREVLIVRDVLAIPARPPVPIALLPVTGVGSGIPKLGQPGQTGQLAAGSVWLFTPPLAQHSPPNNYCGFHIKDGNATLRGQATVGPDGVVHIRPHDVLTVAMDIDAPAAPELNYPASVTFEFRPDGAHITALSAFGLTTYGTGLALTRNAAAPFYEPTSQCILIPADAAPASLAFTSANSTLFIPSGATPITGAAWALHTSTKAVGQLGKAAGAGAVALQLAGISARWSGLAAPVSFASGLLLAEPGQLTFTLQYNGPSFTETYNLWQESATNRRSSIALTCAAGMNVRYFAKPGTETLQVNSCLASAFLDRPVQVDAGRLAVIKWPALFVLNEVAGVVNIGIQAQPPGMQGSVTLALENSLLGLGVPASLGVLGVLDPNGLKNGRLQLDFPFRTILLTLPDPYITPLTTPMSPGQNLTVSAAVTWANPATPSLVFSSNTFSPAPPPSEFNPLRALVDVSSNADQLGVLLFSDFTAAPQFQLQGMDLRGPASAVGLMTLPEISWEPMYSDGSDGSAPGTIASDLDGGISGLRLLNNARLVPTAPALLLTPMLEEAGKGSTLAASLTLPFGLFANINDPLARFHLVQPSFPGSLGGGIQIEMTPPPRLSPINLPPPDQGFLGSASTRSQSYGNEVLGTGGINPANLFNIQFTQLVPLLRYDLSGYGASVFSDWRAATITGTQIIKVQFNVFVGRTSVEVIQIQSLIYPWGITVVRTITIDRKSAGGVLRHDSGWQPVSDGRFQLPGAFQPHPGPVAAVTSVHNIREFGAPFTLDGVLHWETVLFDADFLLASGLSVSGGTSGADRFASREVLGYLPTDVKVVPTPADVNLLLSRVPALGGIGGTLAIAATGAQMRATLIDAESLLSGTTGILVGVLRGNPVLPPQGSWAVGKRAVPAGAPLALDSRIPVPLIRNNADPAWHLADPADILQLSTPVNEYGLLQTTGTQKVFFPRPQMIPLGVPPPPGTPGPGFHLPQPPSLADVGALFNAAGLFPNLSSALAFSGATADLKASPDGLEIHGTIDTSAFPPRPLVDFGVVKVLIDYHDENGVAAKPKVDITPAGWSIALGRITFELITPLGTDPLLKISGNAIASSSAAPTVSDINIVYGGVLAPVENIFANLQSLAKFLPGGNDSSIDVHFADGKLTVREVFALPALPLGAGYLKDIALDIGTTMQLAPQKLEFFSGIGSKEKPCHWLVSPLSGTCMVQVGVEDGDLAVVIQAGIGAGLSIDVGIAEGSASVVIALQVTVVGSNLNLMLLLTAEASVDVLDGLASATLSLTAGLGVTPHPFPPRVSITHPLDSVTLSAAVGVGIHLTVCWLVHVDFDGFWQFSKDIQIPDALSVIPV